MKRPRTSMTFFLGILVVGLVATYAVNRHSVFAAGGGQPLPCPPCDDCVYPYCFWPSGQANVNGQLFDDSKAPAETALLGPQLVAGNATIYTGLDCELFGPIPEGNVLDAVNFSSATGDCIPLIPPPNGVYTGSNGQNPGPTVFTFNQQWCNSD